MSDIKKRFGARVKELREKVGLNQEQLAELVNFDPRHLSRIETGKCFTTIENLEKIANHLHVKPNVLFEYGHEKNREALLNEIKELLCHASEEDIKLIYRLILSVLL